MAVFRSENAKNDGDFRKVFTVSELCNLKGNRKKIEVIEIILTISVLLRAKKALRSRKTTYYI